MRTSLGIGAAAIGVAMLAVAGPAKAAFPDRDITFVIPYGPGGGFDTYVRRIAPVMEKYLPNHVNVIPKNVAGAGGRKAAALLYRDKPDGYTIAIFNMPGMLLDKILGKPTPYNIDKFAWLGRIASSKYVLAVNPKGKYQTVKDLQNASQTLKYAVTSPSSTSYVAGKIMTNILGINVRFLTGYKGSAKISLSLVRGDTQLSLFNTRSFAKWAKGGDLKGVLSFEKKSPFPGVPTVAQIGHPELQHLTIERVVGTTPGVPAKIQKILSDALLSALKDPSIQAWHKKTGRPVDPLSGSETSTLLKQQAVFYSKFKKVLSSK